MYTDRGAVKCVLFIQVISYVCILNTECHCNRLIIQHMM